MFHQEFEMIGKLARLFMHAENEEMPGLLEPADINFIHSRRAISTCVTQTLSLHFTYVNLRRDRAYFTGD